MNQRRFLFINLLLFMFFSSALYANDKADDEVLPIEQLVGRSYKMKDVESNVKLIYTFKEAGKYSFTTDFGFGKMIVHGEYHLAENEVTFYPKEMEARILGFKVNKENMDIKDSAYDPVMFDCYVYKDGILLGDDFYKK